MRLRHALPPSLGSLVGRWTALILAAYAVQLFISSIASAEAWPEDKLPYGFAPNMLVSIIERRGIDTGNATITIEHTREDAAAYCAHMEDTPSTKCIEYRLDTVRVKESVTADCTAGTFTDVYGNRFRIEQGTSWDDDPYRIVSLRTNEQVNTAFDYASRAVVIESLCWKAVQAIVVANGCKGQAFERFDGCPSSPETEEHFDAHEPDDQAEDRLPYGSRAGMEVTVIRRQGIDSTNATIWVEHTRENALAFCTDYRLDPSDACVDEVMASIKVATSLTANCAAGTFTTLRGERYRYRGTQQKEDLPFRFVDEQTGEEPALSNDYIILEAAFRALCPARLAGDDGDSPPEESSDTNTTLPEDAASLFGATSMQCLVGPQHRTGFMRNPYGGDSGSFDTRTDIWVIASNGQKLWVNGRDVPFARSASDHSVFIVELLYVGAPDAGSPTYSWLTPEQKDALASVPQLFKGLLGDAATARKLAVKLDAAEAVFFNLIDGNVRNPVPAQCRRV
ncbi:MAG: hypothetical protein AB7I79_15220 [Rhizobiaceae bacterium]